METTQKTEWKREINYLLDLYRIIHHWHVLKRPAADIQTKRHG